MVLLCHLGPSLEVLILMKSNLSFFFSSVPLSFGVISKNPLLNPRSFRLIPLFFLQEFYDFSANILHQLVSNDPLLVFFLPSVELDASVWYI